MRGTSHVVYPLLAIRMSYVQLPLPGGVKLPLLKFSIAQHGGVPRRYGSCSHLARISATSDFDLRAEHWGPGESRGYVAIA